jgi:hypothetical protein
MPGRCAEPPAPAMIAGEAALASRFRVIEHRVRRAMRRHDLVLEWNAEVLEHLRRVLHHVPVTLGSHHHADLGLFIHLLFSVVSVVSVFQH